MDSKRKCIQKENAFLRTLADQITLLDTMIGNLCIRENAKQLAHWQEVNPKLKFSQATLDSFKMPNSKVQMRMALIGELRYLSQILSDNWKEQIPFFLNKSFNAVTLLPESMVIKRNETLNRYAAFIDEMLAQKCEDRTLDCLPSVRWAKPETLSENLENPLGKWVFRLFTQSLERRYNRLQKYGDERTGFLGKLKI